MKLSIIIPCYNEEKTINEVIFKINKVCIYDKEIIVIDDISTDHSLQILEKYKNKIRYYINKRKTKYGSFNQIESYHSGILKSNGKYLFLLDSDDYFKKDKVKFIINKFIESSSIKILFDLPLLKFQKKIIKNKFIQKKFFFSNWPRFTPQSCISIEKNYSKEIFKILKIKKYPTLWLDFRIATISFLQFKKIYIYKKYLTYYRQLNNSASKNYKTFSRNWWIRRNEAHEFFSDISKKIKINNRMTLDKITTKLINIFINE